jgi:hypothetical protein
MVVSVSNSGTLLPFQAVYQGYFDVSCLDKSAKHYNYATAAGLKFEYSKSKTYWSNQWTMQSLVNDIIAPYFDEQKAKLGLLPSQKSLWQINVFVQKEFAGG